MMCLTSTGPWRTHWLAGYRLWMSVLKSSIFWGEMLGFANMAIGVLETRTLKSGRGLGKGSNHYTQ